MSETASTSVNWKQVAKTADISMVNMQRAIAAVDRFNPRYFFVLSAISASVALIACGLALDQMIDGPVRYDLSKLYALFVFLLAALVAAVGSAAAYREGVVYTRRWRRAKYELVELLKEADALASYGFVAADKIRVQDGDEVVVKNKLVLLQSAMRDASERLGMRD